MARRLQAHGELVGGTVQDMPEVTDRQVLVHPAEVARHVAPDWRMAGPRQRRQRIAGCGKDLRIIKELPFPHSLGLLYSAFTYYTGVKVNSGRYRLMGLAPCGQPAFKDLIPERIVDLKPDGSFHPEQRYFNYVSDLTMTSKAIE